MRLLAILLSVLFTTPVLSETLPTLTVTGEGRVAAAPDMATITLGVESFADVPVEAVDASSAAMAAILDRLRALGLDARDIQTSGLSLQENWENSPGKRKVTGYRARNALTVRVRNLDRLGEVLQAVLEDGANEFSGLSFGLQEPGPLLDRAREAAVQDARDKAALYAAAAGVALGRVLSISEAGGGGGPMPTAMFRTEAAAPVPVAAGETELRADVTMVFEIAAP